MLNFLVALKSMRVISSRRLLGTLTGALNWLPSVGAGKMPPYVPPAVSSDCAFGSSMQSGIVLLGNACPGVTPAGLTPPQFLYRIAGSTMGAPVQPTVSHGARIDVLPKLPP